MPDSPGLWRDHDFLRLWSAQATGLVGQQFSVLSLPLVAILTLHASASTVGLMVTCFNLPWVVFGLFVGVVIDRFPRRSVLILSDLGRALLLVSIPLCAAAGLLTLQQLFVLGLLVGTLDVCWLTAYRSYIPTVVPKEHLTQAYSLVGASDGVTRTAAPSLAGAAIQLVGAPIGVSVTSLCYFLSGLFNSRIRAREQRVARGDHEPVLRSFREGLAYAWRQRIVRSFALSEATYTLFWASTQTVLLVFLSRNLDLAPGFIGLIFTVGTVGGILGALVARRIGRRLTPGPSIILGSILRSAGMALLPLAVVLGPFAIPMLMLARLVNSFGWTLWDVHRETMQQQLLSDRYRGRANGSVLFLSGAALAVGSAAGAGVVALTGVVPTLVIGCVGTMLAVGWLLTARLSTLRQALATD
ncbi:MAG TPA: MFS transporter [Mycobacteriales bacterium]|jgi:MFS family permease|nr:MFS transporter [Mycobacteriales bacterium]